MKVFLRLVYFSWWRIKIKWFKHR